MSMVTAFCSFALTYREARATNNPTASFFCFTLMYRETRATNSPAASFFGFALTYSEMTKVARLQFLTRSFSRCH